MTGATDTKGMGDKDPGVEIVTSSPHPHAFNQHGHGGDDDDDDDDEGHTPAAATTTTEAIHDDETATNPGNSAAADEEEEAAAAAGAAAAADNPRHGQTGERQGRFGYLRTREFWIVLLIGQTLALCITGTNTLTTLLVGEGTSIPAFQTLFNYVLLNVVFTSYTIYRYGIRRWLRLLVKDGWKYLILSFLDVEGNYFTVLAYRYTTILSAQLINFWAIVIVVAVSFLVLRVRYHRSQIGGIVVCVGGMGILLASDQITGGGDDGEIPRSDQLRGDLFAVAGATFYGLANVAEEFLVSRRSLYEVVGQLGLWGMLINGCQAGIFDRASFRTAAWNGRVAGYLAGYTLILSLFYTTVPILYRLASAAFFNVSLLTANFWGVVIGVRVFGYSVHFLYPLAFVLIMVGQVVYFLGKGFLGEAKKVWLGEHQERGIAGLGTAKRKILKGNGAAAATTTATTTGDYDHDHGTSTRQGTEHVGAGLV